LNNNNKIKKKALKTNQYKAKKLKIKKIINKWMNLSNLNIIIIIIDHKIQKKMKKIALKINQYKVKKVKKVKIFNK
jgi:hypothetical protein